MRHLIILVSTFFVYLFAQTGFANTESKIIDWEPTLPVTQEQVLDVIHIKADESLYGNDPTAVKCGGEYDNPEMVGYYTYLDQDKEVVHKINVLVVMAKYIGRCQKQAVYECTAPFTIYSSQSYRLDNWNCKLLAIN